MTALLLTGTATDEGAVDAAAGSGALAKAGVAAASLVAVPALDPGVPVAGSSSKAVWTGGGVIAAICATAANGANKQHKVATVGTAFRKLNFI
jgi:hypothetical protein